MRILIWTSVYPPDPAAVGQHMYDIARWAARRGNETCVITSNRGYENPGLRYKKHEYDSNVEIKRLGLSSFGKTSFISRVVGQIIFSLQALLRGLGGPAPDLILVSTTPPFGIIGAWLLSRLRHAALVYWVMDINPDQAIVMGMVKPRSIFARVLEGLNKRMLRSADAVIALDKDMADRLLAKAETRKPIAIIPPWSQEEGVAFSGTRGREFRKAHGLGSKFVVMYSGNHSWVHPLDTVLMAAKELESRGDIRFVFVGQGNEKFKVEEAIRRGAANILSLPFQPLEYIGESLAAADVHLVVMGDAMVGIVHPCKIYNAMLVGKPILAIAPENCYIKGILDGNRIGMRFGHGEHSRLAQGIIALAEMDPEERAEMGRRARALVQERWGQATQVNRLLDVLETASRGEG